MSKKFIDTIFIDKMTLLISMVWLILSLYFISSIPTPKSLYDYDRQLHTKEIVLQRNLEIATQSGAPQSELIKIYQLLSGNENCLGDLSAADKHLKKAWRTNVNHFGENTDFNETDMAEINLVNGNLSRDLGKFDQAKSAYQYSLSALQQIPLSPKIKEDNFNIAVADFNNLGILYFMIGQEAKDDRQREKYSEQAEAYFQQAKHLIYVLGLYKKGCYLRQINANLKQNLTEMQSIR